MIVLTDAERNHFVAYLEQEAKQVDGLVEQMKKISSSAVSMGMLESYRTEAAVYIKAAMYLTRGEKMEIRG